mmetsp:Transcript_22028/g.46460  ORF Transcript_22028/g.46460 Transcript_22028/m.46460 type:complete len:102 (+) Transcript_22028:65-370(+)
MVTRLNAPKKSFSKRRPRLTGVQWLKLTSSRGHGLIAVGRLKFGPGAVVKDARSRSDLWLDISLLTSHFFVAAAVQSESADHPNPPTRSEEEATVEQLDEG